jgi:hypothetical protein
VRGPQSWRVAFIGSTQREGDTQPDLRSMPTGGFISQIGTASQCRRLRTLQLSYTAWDVLKSTPRRAHLSSHGSNVHARKPINSLT